MITRKIKDNKINKESKKFNILVVLIKSIVTMEKITINPKKMAKLFQVPSKLYECKFLKKPYSNNLKPVIKFTISNKEIINPVKNRKIKNFHNLFSVWKYDNDKKKTMNKVKREIKVPISKLLPKKDK